MSKPFVFEKPVGFKDTLPDVVAKKNKLVQTIAAAFKQWGYQFIETPTLEFFDTVGGFSSTMEQRLFKLLDSSGRSLVLRPDMTTPIARVIGSVLKEQPFPIRLAYQGNVFRAQENEAGRNAEFAELGIELVGEKAPDADAEVIALAISALQAAQVPHFKVALGHIGLMNAIFRGNLGDQQKEAELRHFLHRKNYVGYRSYVEQAEIASEQKENLLSLLEVRGGREQLAYAARWATNTEAKQALQELEELWEVLAIHGVTEQVMVDLSLISQRDYYTGVLFEAYAEQLGFPVFSGGRYDHLLAQFGRPAPAIGFALKLERILEVSQISPERKRKVLITYTEVRRKEALAQAQNLRAQQAEVTLHRLYEEQEQVLLQATAFDEHIHLGKEGTQDV